MAQSVAEYLAELPPDRREALTQLRSSVLPALPSGFEEALQYGMISYVVPLARFPKTYNGQPLAVLAIASQKQYMALHLLGLYGRDELRTWFERAYAKSGKKLDMGKACLRFKHLDDLALDVVREALGKVSPAVARQ
ncbi:MAG TPA: DUF1801 domain-containing protein [Polyangiales bacterium]|nr:DUF1801 domain-containing protein [Polyangiales bacterium]